MKLDDKLHTILGTAPRRAPEVERTRLAWVYRMLGRPWTLLWEQSSVSVAAAVALAVMLVYACSKPVPSRLWAPPVASEMALLRSRSGNVWQAGTTVGGTARPARVTRGPSGGARLLLQDADTAEVVAVDSVSGQVVAHVASPWVSRLLPRGFRYFAVDRESTALSDIAPDTLKVTPLYQSPQVMGDVWPGPDGRSLFVSFPQQDTVAWLDGSHRVGQNLSVPGGPMALYVPPDGAALWVACRQSHDIKVVSLLQHGPAPVVIPYGDDDVVAMLGGGDHVYVIGRHSVTVVEGWSGQVVTVVPCIGQDPVAWTLAPVSHTLAVATATPPGLELLDISAPGPMTSVPLPEVPTSLWLKP